VILEGFEIEHWSCIERLTVADLPATGVVILYGPNRTGKSSIVQALRACLLDFPASSASKELKRWFPKNNSAKPRVRITFRAQGRSLRITKQYGTRESKLESRTSAGTWKLEQSTASDAHEAVRRLAGGKDSDSGLQQLLWLTQAEFHLPDPRNFDPDVQSQLRAVLGVLQTPLDDRFLARIKGEWSRWFNARGRPAEKPKLKKDCPLDKLMTLLRQRRTELTEIEAEYQEAESMMARSAGLEVRSRDLRRQLADKTRERDLLQDEYENSLKRLEAHRFARERAKAAENLLSEKQADRKRRADALERALQAEREAENAGRDVEERARALDIAEVRLKELKSRLLEVRNAGRETQALLSALNTRREIVTWTTQVTTARENLSHAEQAAKELKELQREDRERAAPDAALLKHLDDNRASATLLRAKLDAAAIVLTVLPDLDSPAPIVTIDETAEEKFEALGDRSPISRLVRRRAAIGIPNWGRLDISRGSDARSLDELETDLGKLDREFGESLAPFGLVPRDPTALDRLRKLEAEKRVRDPLLRAKQAEVKRIAPLGLDTLRQEVKRLERLLQAHQAEAISQPSGARLSLELLELETEAARLKKQMEAIEKDAADVDRQIRICELEINGPREPASAPGKAEESVATGKGLRPQLEIARVHLATQNAKARHCREELDRIVTAKQIENAVHNAEAQLAAARAELTTARLSESEETIRERREAAIDGVIALERLLAETEKDFHQLEGGLRTKEGLHQKRAAIAAQVEELSHQTDRQTTESEAYDRLYCLFEECREKQFGAVMKPVEDRVLRWMRLLRIGGYESIRFNDQFLPAGLIASGGAAEWLVGEESTGTIEQIGLMVRLALGSVLSRPEEPVIAILDDPLTHSDGVKLDRMRAVLRNAANGDATSAPPAGPLQILIFTCHPEWFTLDGSKGIDLSSPDVLTRAPGIA
jgi:hypothetical protein